MYGSTVLNTKLSAIVSILSGIGFVTVLTLAPINPPKEPNEFQIDEPQEIQEYIDEPEKAKFIENKKEDEQVFFSVKTIRGIQEEISQTIWREGFQKETIDILPPLLNESQNRVNQSIQPDIFSYYKDEKISMTSIGDTRAITNKILEYKYENKMTDNIPLQQSRISQLKNVEVSYQINSNLSASFKSTRFDLFDDRLRQYPTTMAGINYSGNKYISTGFIAGDTTIMNPYRFTQNGNLNGNNYSRETDAYYRELDRANKNLFEWQTNISPTKNLLFQTAVYNSNRSLINETNISEGARLAMAVGMKYFILNLKYNYLSDNLLRTVFRPDLASAFNKDFAAFGFTFFLDKYKKYSIYVGNNYYNIMTTNIPTNTGNSIPVNNSFSASFRGKNSDSYNTTFFLNFKNNANKDYYYSSFGVFKLPIYSQLNFEYATSLGLEFSF